jgi:hypothetical protein
MTSASAILIFPADPDLRQLAGRRIPLTFSRLIYLALGNTQWLWMVMAM